MKPAQTVPPNRLTVSVGVQCHPGSVRTENQDRVSRASTPYGDLYVVADGVGGYQGGAEAAQAVVDGFAERLSTSSSAPLADTLTAAAQAINSQLEQRGREQDPPAKMGSTVVLAVIEGSSATVAHVGDSRAYLVRSGKLSQITRDHSVVQRLIDQGEIEIADAREHASASVLTQALGQTGEVEIDVTQLELYSEDALLLCSDGLWGFTTDDEIEAIAASRELSPSGCAEALLHLALQGGGGDNVSIQFLRFLAEPAPVLPIRKFFGVPARIAIPVVAVLLAGVAVAAGLTGWNYLHGALPTPARPANSEQPQRTAIHVIDDAGNRPGWASQLTEMNNLDVVPATAQPSCLALEQHRDLILYKPQRLKAARRVQQQLGLGADSLLELNPSSQECGSGDLFALPAGRGN